MIFVNKVLSQYLGWMPRWQRFPVVAIRQAPLLGFLVMVIFMATPACQRHLSLLGKESGALGLSRSDWERHHGSAIAEDSAYARYHLDDADVFLNFVHGGGATYVLVKYSTKDKVALEVARSFARTLVPVDSTLIRTYFPEEGGTADSFISDALTHLDEDWEGYPSGSFTIWYSIGEGGVSGFTIRTGKSPK